MKLIEVNRLKLKDYPETDMDDEYPFYGNFFDAVNKLKKQSIFLLAIDKDNNKTWMSKVNMNGGLCDCCREIEPLYSGHFAEVIGYKVEE